jgi:hypothetical protein
MIQKRSKSPRQNRHFHLKSEEEMSIVHPY